MASKPNAAQKFWAWVFGEARAAQWTDLQHSMTGYFWWNFYPPRPGFPPQPWHDDGDAAFTVRPEIKHPRSQAYIQHLVATGGIKISTGSVRPHSDGRIDGYPLNRSGEGDPEWVTVAPDAPLGPGKILVYNGKWSPPKSDLGIRTRIPKDAILQGWPMRNYSDAKLHVFDVERRVITEFQHFEWLANGGARVHGVSQYSLDTPSWDAHGSSAAKQPLAELTLRYDDVILRKQVRRTSMGVRAGKKDEFVWPAIGTDGRSTETDAIPFGTVLRLSADAVRDLLEQKPGPQAHQIIACLAGPGVIVVDSAGHNTISLEPDPDWDQDDLAFLQRVKVTDFEVWTLKKVA